jgi:TonB-dependent SusC/RagA subfamily outer membrane receptor
VGKVEERRMKGTACGLAVTFLVACGRTGSSPAHAPAPEDSVVTGYGAQLREQQAGAVTSIFPTEAQTRVARVEDLLSGSVPGLQVIRLASGSFTLRIRGQHTISGRSADAEPLLVIDGTSVPQGQLGTALAAFAPRDVARIDVLKDASATSIFGSRGANGVIIITTKRAP